MKALKPCPFCGSDGEMIHPMGNYVGEGRGPNGGAYGPNGSRIICVNGPDCCAGTRTFLGPNQDAEAVAAWNTRSPPLPAEPVAWRELRDKIQRKMDRVHPSNRRSDLPVLPKLTFGELGVIVAALSAAPHAPAHSAEKATEGRVIDAATGAEVPGPITRDLVESMKLHHATAALVNSFAWALAEKLSKAEQKYGYTDGWQNDDWEDECRAKLMEHIAKGDPRDVAAYCAFMWRHGWSTAPEKHSGTRSRYTAVIEAVRLADRQMDTLREALAVLKSTPDASEPLPSRDQAPAEGGGR